MKRTVAGLAAVTLLATAAHTTGVALANEKNGTSTETPAQSGAEDGTKDEGLKSIEQGFSIPAADGAANEGQTQKKAPPRK